MVRSQGGEKTRGDWDNQILYCNSSNTNRPNNKNSYNIYDNKLITMMIYEIKSNLFDVKISIYNYLTNVIKIILSKCGF